MVALQLGLAVGFSISTGYWWGYLFWVVPLLVVAVFLNRTRLMVEHGLALQVESGGGHRIATVDVVAPAWQRALFSPFLFNYHCCHHLFMAVPHYNLPKLHALLKERNHPGLVVWEGDYPSAFRRVLFGG